MQIKESRLIAQIVWLTLIAAVIAALVLGRWSMAFVATGTLALSLAPAVIARWMKIELPWPFLSGIVVFIFASLFLGEWLNFYELYWWWDIFLHTFSAIGFGLMGFVFIFALFEGDRYAAPPWAIGFISMCVAISIGVLWEIFEYTMDQNFGTNMQKSGLRDTMWDLIMDTIGGFIGGFSGAGFLKGQQMGGMSNLIEEFVSRNKWAYRKYQDFRARRDRKG